MAGKYGKKPSDMAVMIGIGGEKKKGNNDEEPEMGMEEGAEEMGETGDYDARVAALDPEHKDMVIMDLIDMVDMDDAEEILAKHEGMGGEEEEMPEEEEGFPEA